MLYNLLKMKKVYKIIFGVLIFLIAVIVTIPILFEDKIIDLVKQTTNKNLHATFDFKDAELTIFKSFPNAEVSLKEASLVNKFPFEGDTLFKVKDIALQLSIKELFKNSGPLSITNFTISGAILAIKIDSSGNANYDIAIKQAENTTESSSDSGGIQLALDSYEIISSEISYVDVSSETELKLKNFNHSGNGNLSEQKLDLKTKTKTLTELTHGGVKYLSNNQLALDAIIGIDLVENTYTFLENTIQINQLPLIFDGFVKLNEDSQEINIKFKTLSSDFKNFLALIPELYSKSLTGVTTTGKFDVLGTVNGVMDQNNIPQFDILINSQNASFKYPDLPKTIENIHINTEIGNKTGIIKDTYVVIDTLSFKIDEDIFNASAKITELTENLNVAAKFRGKINLGNLEKAYPAEELKNLKGKLYVNAKTGFDILSIEKKQYQKAKVSGVFTLSDFIYIGADLRYPLQISKAAVTLNPQKVLLDDFNAKIGNTDLSMHGNIDNLLGFFFNNEDMQGNFDLASAKFVVNDFMSNKPKDSLSESVNSTPQSIKVPSFLNATIKAKAQAVLYDDITLKNVSGTLILKDQKALLHDMNSSVFDGLIGFTGSVDTKEDIPTFQMDLNFDKINVAESFAALHIFQALAPIAIAIDGKLNSTLKMTGNLKKDLSPDLNSLNGSVFTQLISANLETGKIPALQLLEQNLQFINLKKLNLDNQKVNLKFENGKVVMSPLKVNYRDMKLDISGGHGFDNTMNYNTKINVPAKYLGKGASQSIARLSEKELEKIEIPVNALISGSFKAPIVKTDLQAAVTTLAQQLVTKQKDKLVEQGTENITNTINEFINKDEKIKDSTGRGDSVKTNINDTEVIVKDVLNSIFSSKEKEKDSIN